MEPDELSTFYTANYIGATSYKVVPLAWWNDGYPVQSQPRTMVTNSTFFAANGKWGTTINQNPITLQSDSFYGSAPYIGVYDGIREAY